ncbi:nicotinate-nucleotide adenylyltransferase [Pseudoxanthomonas mexicana]|uniref:nicotinate-nucleotide adenylyltransferase n=1 Tax=Pseudoxanthomonas mexicana TaxID=128785 RepID=UPI00398B6D18
MRRESRDPEPGIQLHLWYGGTFDPIHNGHLAVARAARDALHVPVHLMPAADPPHRTAPGASAAQRACMLELAIEGERDLRVDLRELRRAEREPGQPSYTLDTVREMRAEAGPEVPLALLIGADSLLGLPTWRQWRALPDYVHFVVAGRPGSRFDPADAPELAGWLRDRWTDSPQALAQAPAGRFYRLEHPLRPESASQVRALIAAGRPWRHLLPAAVAAYIEAQGLYFTPAAAAGPV